MRQRRATKKKWNRKQKTKNPIKLFANVYYYYHHHHHSIDAGMICNNVSIEFSSPDPNPKVMEYDIRIGMIDEWKEAVRMCGNANKEENMQ